MTQVDVHEAAPRLADLIARARAGEAVVISEEGRPVVRLVPEDQQRSPRIFGEFEGRIHVADDFASPANEQELAEWEQ